MRSSALIRNPIVGCVVRRTTAIDYVRLVPRSVRLHSSATTTVTFARPPRIASTSPTRAGFARYHTIFARAFRSHASCNVEDTTEVPSNDNVKVVQRATLSVRGSNGLIDVQRDWTPGPEALRALQQDESNHFWLDIVQPDSMTLKTLQDVFGLHSLTVEDFENRESREKIEHFPKYQLVSYAAFVPTTNVSQPFKQVTFYIISFAKGTITLQSDFTTMTEGIVRRLSSESGPECLSTKWLLHASVDCITDELDVVRTPFRRQIENLSLDSLRRPTESLLGILKEVVSARIEANSHRVLLGHKGEVLRKLIRQEESGGGSAAGRTKADMHFQDVEDHLLNASQELSAWESALDRIETSLFARLQLTAAKNSEDSNAAMSQLTTLGTVLVPLNIITGLWGMNVNVPGQGAEGLLWFASLASSMAVVAACGYLFARRILRRSRK